MKSNMRPGVKAVFFFVLASIAVLTLAFLMIVTESTWGDATNQDIVDAINGMSDEVAQKIMELQTTVDNGQMYFDPVAWWSMQSALDHYDGMGTYNGSVWKDRDQAAGGSLQGGVSVFKEFDTSNPAGAGSVFRDSTGRSFFREAGDTTRPAGGSVFTDNQGVSWLRKIYEGQGESTSESAMTTHKNNAAGTSVGASQLTTRGDAVTGLVASFGSAPGTSLPAGVSSSAKSFSILGAATTIGDFAPVGGLGFSTWLDQYAWLIQGAFYALLGLSFIPHWWRLILAWDLGASEQ